MGEKEIASNLLLAAEKKVHNFKEYWYLNQKHLGDMLRNYSACKALTTTYNNIGVYYKSEQKPNVAIKYLKQVLEIEQEMEVSEFKDQEISSTYINICTIYSGMKKHDIALQYIMKAINYLNEIYEEKIQTLEDEKERKQFIQIVATAYHNAAVEFEYLENFQKSMEHYSRALAIAETHLGQDHPLSQAFVKSMNDARIQMERVIQKRKSSKSLKPQASRQRNLSRGASKQSGLRVKPPRAPSDQRFGPQNRKVSLPSMSPRREASPFTQGLANVLTGLPYVPQEVITMQQRPSQKVVQRKLRSNLNIQDMQNSEQNQSQISTRSKFGMNDSFSSGNDYRMKDYLTGNNKRDYFNIKQLLEVSRHEIKDFSDKELGSILQSQSSSRSPYVSLQSNSKTHSALANPKNWNYEKKSHPLADESKMNISVDLYPIEEVKNEDILAKKQIKVLQQEDMNAQKPKIQVDEKKEEKAKVQRDEAKTYKPKLKSKSKAQEITEEEILKFEQKLQMRKVKHKSRERPYEKIYTGNVKVVKQSEDYIDAKEREMTTILQESKRNSENKKIKEDKKKVKERENNTVQPKPEEKFYLLEEDKQRDVRIAMMKFKQNLKSKLLLRSFKLKHKESILKLRFREYFNRVMKKEIIKVLQTCSKYKSEQQNQQQSSQQTIQNPVQEQNLNFGSLENNELVDNIKSSPSARGYSPYAFGGSLADDIKQIKEQKSKASENFSQYATGEEMKHNDVQYLPEQYNYHNSHDYIQRLYKVAQLEQYLNNQEESSENEQIIKMSQNQTFKPVIRSRIKRNIEGNNQIGTNSSQNQQANLAQY